VNVILVVVGSNMYNNNLLLLYINIVNIIVYIINQVCKK